MTFQQFEELQESIFNEIRSMSESKGREYANGEDRFLNFKEIGSSLALDPKSVLWVYVTKHIRSVESFLKSGKTFSNETIEGRILDIIVYMMLLRGLLKDEDMNSPPPNIDAYWQERAAVILGTYTKQEAE
jgi:hypothetical protein